MQAAAVSGGIQAPVDAFTAEIVRSALVSITDEMKDVLMRTAYHMIIYDAEDFTVGLFDREGNTISIGLGFPMMIRGISETIKSMLAFYGEGGLVPGDVVLTNNGYIHGSHIYHMVFTAPIFHDGQLVAFSSSMAHWQDIGGVWGGVTRDIYSEGLQIPFVKIFAAGAQNPELTALIRTNVRDPDSAMGDMRAQVASVRTGERRLKRLLERFGERAFSTCVETMFDQSERRARAVVRQIPDGVYEASSFMDDDSVTRGKPVPLHARVIVQDDQMTIDLSECSPQVAGDINSGIATGRSVAEVAFKFVTSPLELPINEGSFRPLKLILPVGRVVSARKPAAIRRWMVVPMTLTDTIFKALSTACPDRVIAAHGAELAAQSARFIDPKTGLQKSGPGAVPGEGWGAVSDADGQCATICINDGDTHTVPVEAAENKYPLILTKRELRQNSGGPGRFRGGLGARQEMLVRIPAVVEPRVERTVCAPWGLLGGKEALPNRMGLVRLDGSVTWGKFPPTEVAPGEGYISEAGGGGGFGDPFERDPDRVLADVRAGYVSVDAARSAYGVAVRQSGPRRFVLDRLETQVLRRSTS